MRVPLMKVWARSRGTRREGAKLRIITARVSAPVPTGTGGWSTARAWEERILQRDLRGAVTCSWGTQSSRCNTTGREPAIKSLISLLAPSFPSRVSHGPNQPEARGQEAHWCGPYRTGSGHRAGWRGQLKLSDTRSVPGTSPCSLTELTLSFSSQRKCYGRGQVTTWMNYAKCKRVKSRQEGTISVFWIKALPLFMYAHCTYTEKDTYTLIYFYLSALIWAIIYSLIQQMLSS